MLAAGCLCLAAAAAWLGPLLYPRPLFRHLASLGRFHVWSDRRVPIDAEALVRDVEGRLAGMEPADQAPAQHVYLCHSPRLYRLFAFLTRRSPDSLAIGLSATHSSFVSMAKLERFAAANRGTLRHTRFEGNLAQAVAHEMAHGRSIRILGLRRHLRLAVWKSEGWAEYQSNRAALRADPAYDLHERIDQLQDAALWSRFDPHSRGLWEAQLLVEFLGEVEGRDLPAIASDELVEAEVRERMRAWHRAGR